MIVLERLFVETYSAGKKDKNIIGLAELSATFVQPQYISHSERRAFQDNR